MIIYEVIFINKDNKNYTSNYKNNHWHRLNDRGFYVFLNYNFSYWLNGVIHRENNQFADYNNYRNKEKCKFLCGELKK